MTPTAKLDDNLPGDTSTFEFNTSLHGQTGVHVSGAIDLGSAQNVNIARFTGYALNAGGYTLAYSLDDITYLPIDDQFPGWGGWNYITLTFASTMMRYVRVAIVDQEPNDDPVEARIGDFRLYLDDVTVWPPGAPTPPDPPSPPTNPGVCEGTQATLSWGAVSGALFYSVYVDGSFYASTTELSMVVTGLTLGVAYSFTLTVTTADGESGQSSSLVVTPCDDTPPTPPNPDSPWQRTIPGAETEWGESCRPDETPWQETCAPPVVSWNRSCGPN